MRTVGRWAVVVVLFAFIGRSLIVNWDQLAEADLHFELPLLVGSVVVLALWMLGQAVIWHLLTVTNGVAIPLPRAIAAWFYSQLGKYIPGKVFLFLGRLHFYAREGRPAGPVTVAFGVETMGTLAASMVIVLIAALTADVPELERYRWILVGALVALLAALHPKLIDWLIGLTARVLRRAPFRVTMGYWQILRYVGLYVLNWSILGAALYLFIRSFYVLEVSSILYLTGAFSFAATLGILAVFAPSGLGVREGVLAVFLSQVMPTSVALLVSVASRIWLTIVELASAGAVYLAIRLRWIDVGEVAGFESIDGGGESIGQ